MAYILTKDDTLRKSKLKGLASWGTHHKDDSYIVPDDYKPNLEMIKRKSLLKKRSGEYSTKEKEEGYYHHACPMCYSYEVLADKIYHTNISQYRKQNKDRKFPIKSAYCVRCSYEWGL